MTSLLYCQTAYDVFIKFQVYDVRILEPLDVIGQCVNRHFGAVPTTLTSPHSSTTSLKAARWKEIWIIMAWHETAIAHGYEPTNGCLSPRRSLRSI